MSGLQGQPSTHPHPAGVPSISGPSSPPSPPAPHPAAPRRAQTRLHALRARLSSS